MTFDAPGAVCGTLPSGLNSEGAIIGQSFDASCNGHGFVRARNGSFAIFDPTGSTYTQPVAINPAGTITGSYLDAGAVFHGFLRAPDGTITTFDIPGGSTVFAGGINPSETVVGYYIDASGVSPWLRKGQGRYYKHI